MESNRLGVSKKYFKMKKIKGNLAPMQSRSSFSTRPERIEVGMYRTRLLSPLSGVRNMWWKFIPGQGTSQDMDSEVEMECVCDSEKGIFLILA